MKLILAGTIIILGAFSVIQAQTAKHETIKIAAGKPVVIDGKMEEAEWKDASVFDLTGGGRIFLKHDGEYLYFGVRGAKHGWSQLYLSEGESTDVYVLHASAALGMSVYRLDKNRLWQPANDFSWELRDRTINADTNKKMADYLAKNFWVANNNNMNNKNESEFQLKPRNSAARHFRLAVEYVTGDEKQFFPATLDDDSLKSKLALGFAAPDLKFNHGQWAKISLENKPTK
jgi:hypothetical protein